MTDHRNLVRVVVRARGGKDKYVKKMDAEEVGDASDVDGWGEPWTLLTAKDPTVAGDQ